MWAGLLREVACYVFPLKNIYHAHSFVERYVKVTCLLSLSLAVCLETKIRGRRFRIDKRDSTLYMMYL